MPQFKHLCKNDPLIGAGAYKFRHYSVKKPTGTFSYEITSISSAANADVTVAINDGLGNTVTYTYYSSMSSAKQVIIGEGATMTINWSGSGGDFTVTIYVNGVSTTFIDTYGSHNIALNYGDVITMDVYAIDATDPSICLTGDTLITLADGTEKRIDELTMSDKVLGYDPDTLELVPQKITMCDSMCEKYGDEYVRYTFSDGKHVDVVHRHAFYNSDFGVMACLDSWELGMHARAIDGSMPELVNVEKVVKRVRHYTVFTEHQNYFANGLLSGNRFTEKLFFDLYKED